MISEKEIENKPYGLTRRTGVNTYYYVHFRYLGKLYRRSTKTKDLEKAHKIAQELYDAVCIHGNPDIHVADELQERSNSTVNNAKVWSYDEMEAEIRKRIGKGAWTEDRMHKRAMHLKKAAQYFGKPFWELTSDDFTQENMDGAYDFFVNQGVRPRYINTIFTELSFFWKILRLPIWKPHAKVTPTPFVAPEPEVMERIWEDRHSLPVPGFRMLMLMMGGGLRRGETVYAKWNWLDFHNKSIHITPDRDFKPKTGIGRTVPFFPDCLDELLASKTATETEYDGDRIVSYAVKPSSSYVYFGGIVAKYVKERGLKGPVRGSLHNLRKYYGSVIISKTGSIYKAQAALGHKSFRTTEETYTCLINALEDDYEGVYKK